MISKKISITISVLLNWYSSMRKNSRKIRIIYDRENWLWMSNFGTFWHLSLTQFSIFNNFLWICWFLDKNLSNFLPPAWKLHNRYCHDTKILVPKSQIIWNPIFDFEDLEFWFLYITGRKLRKNIYKTSVHREKWLGFSTFSFLTKIT